MELTKEKLQALRAAMDVALAQVAKANGLDSLKAGNVTYDRAGSFTFKVEGRVSGGLAREQSIYDANPWLKLPPRGTKFTQGGHVHECWGLNNRATKVITLRDDGKSFQWPIDVVKRLCPQDPIAGDLKKIVGACKQ